MNPLIYQLQIYPESQAFDHYLYLLVQALILFYTEHLALFPTLDFHIIHHNTSSSPHRSDYSELFDNDDYAKLDAFTKNYVEGMGCMYVNINDLPSTRVLLTDDYFEDVEHVSKEGREVASGIMSDILKLLLGVY